MVKPVAALYAAGALLIAFAAWRVYRAVAEGGVAGVAGAVTDAALAVPVGVAEGVSGAIGITPPSLTITDVDRCREYLGQYGTWAASERCSAKAFLAALWRGETYYSNEGRAR